MSHDQPIHRTDPPLEDYRPGPDELSSLRGRPVAGHSIDSGITEQFCLSQPADSARLAEIEQARLDLMMASLEAAASSPDTPATCDETPPEPMEHPATASPSGPAATVEPAPSPIGSHLPSGHLAPHASHHCHDKAIAKIMDEIVRNDIDFFNRNRKS